MLLDVGIAWISFQLAFYVRFSLMPVPEDLLANQEFAPYMRMALLAMPARLFAGRFANLYQKRPRPYRVIEDLPKVFTAVSMGTGILMVIAYLGIADWNAFLDFRDFSFSRIVLVADWIISLLLFGAVHVSAGLARNAIFRRGVGTRRLAVQGLGREAQRIARLERTLAASGYTLVGFVGSEQDGAPTAIDTSAPPYLGATANISDIINEHGLHEIIVTNVRGLDSGFLRFCDDCHQLGVVVRLAPDLAGLLFQGQPIEVVGGIPLIQVNHVGIEGVQELAKRIEDLVIGSLLLLCLAPLMALVALVIKLDSKGPALFIQRRLGKNGRVIHVYKFRSMVVDAEERRKELEALNESDGVLFKMKADPRITRAGRVIRRLSIDELPQLFNVLKGDMSLVGPRPLPVMDISSPDEWERKRFAALPGITGLWQVNRTEHTTEEMLKWDLYYIENWSVWLDIQIMAKTALVVLFSRGAY